MPLSVPVSTSSRRRPQVGDIYEVVWLGEVRAVLKVTEVYSTHFRCDDGSRWFFYGMPYENDPWGVRVRYASTPPTASPTPDGGRPHARRK